jgi:single-strand DNA-binding protein
MTTTAPATAARPTRLPSRPADAAPDTSITLITGALSRPAERRELPSGDSLVTLELTSRCGPGSAESVPVVWPEAPAWADTLATGDRVVVVGRVRRRFFRAGGATASRTEVVAERVVPEAKRARVRAAVDLARRRLAPLDDRSPAEG